MIRIDAMTQVTVNFQCSGSERQTQVKEFDRGNTVLVNVKAISSIAPIHIPIGHEIAKIDNDSSWRIIGNDFESWYAKPTMIINGFKLRMTNGDTFYCAEASLPELLNPKCLEI